MEIYYSVDDGVYIKNENGTSTRKCKCGSWLHHWELFGGQKASTCCVSKCHNDAEHGAHVTRPWANNDDYKTHVYIVPMCPQHNSQHGDSFHTKDHTTFVWANVSKTCGH